MRGEEGRRDKRDSRRGEQVVESSSPLSPFSSRVGAGCGLWGWTRSGVGVSWS